MDNPGKLTPQRLHQSGF